MSAPQEQGQVPAQTAQTAQPGQQEDYLDKGLDAVEKKFGTSSGHNIDTTKMRSTNEKITDSIRGTFEKMTGKKVPEKFSN